MFSLVAMLLICACSGPSYTKEKWVYSDVLSINVNEDIDESLLQAYLENKGVTSVSELETILLKEAKEEEIKTLKQLLTDLTPAQEKERQKQLANQKRARTRLCYAMMDSGMSNEDILLTTDIPAAVVSRIRIEFNKRKK